jgi:hypothetical protein
MAVLPPSVLRLNPAADIQGRLDNLRRVAAPGSGTSDNERAIALRLIARMEAELRASGGTPSPAPSAPPPSASSTWRAPPPAASTSTATFTPIPLEYRSVVAADLRPLSEGGKGFGSIPGGADYEFVRARTIPHGFGQTQSDGYILLTIPRAGPPYWPVLNGFYGEDYRGPASAGRYKERLDLKSDGLYTDTGRKVYSIDPSDVKKLDKMGAFFQ